MNKPLRCAARPANHRGSRVVVGQVVLVQYHVTGGRGRHRRGGPPRRGSPNTSVLRLASPAPQRGAVGVAHDGQLHALVGRGGPGEARRCAAPASGPSSTIPGVTSTPCRPRRRVTWHSTSACGGPVRVGVVGVVDDRDARVERSGLRAVRGRRHRGEPVEDRLLRYVDRERQPDRDGDVDRVADLGRQRDPVLLAGQRRRSQPSASRRTTTSALAPSVVAAADHPLRGCVPIRRPRPARARRRSARSCWPARGSRTWRARSWRGPSSAPGAPRRSW